MLKARSKVDILLLYPGLRTPSRSIYYGQDLPTRSLSLPGSLDGQDGGEHRPLGRCGLRLQCPSVKLWQAG